MGKIKSYTTIGTDRLTDSDVLLVETNSGTRTLYAKPIADTYTKAFIDSKLDLYYTKTQVEGLLDNKANVGDVPTNTQLSTALDNVETHIRDKERGLKSEIERVAAAKTSYVEYENRSVDLYNLTNGLINITDVIIFNLKNCTVSNAPTGINGSVNSTAANVDGYVIYSKHDEFRITAELTVYNGNKLEKYFNYSLQSGSSQRTWGSWTRISTAERLTIPSNSNLNSYHNNNDSIGTVIYYIDGATGITNSPFQGADAIWGYLVVSKHISGTEIHIEQTLYAKGDICCRSYSYDPQVENTGTWSNWRCLSDTDDDDPNNVAWRYVSDNADLNDCKGGDNPGMSFYDLSWATNIQHAPVALNKGAYMVVAKHRSGSTAVYVEQTLHFHSQIFTRYFFYDPQLSSVSAWSAWVKMATADDIADLQSQIDNIHTGGEYPNADEEVF